MKPNQIKLAAQAVLASAVIHDLVIHWRMKRAAKEICESNDQLHQLTDTLMDDNQKLADELQTAERKCEYLAKIIDEHDVPITEFDVIVYTNLI